MATERSVNSTIRTTLINNEAFEYAHLVKFERPQLPNANNTFSTNASKFAYLTDGSRDISFNDGSTNDSGSANGSQIYRANKLLRVTGYKESMQAKATSMTLTVAAEVLGTSVVGNLTFSSSTITCSTLIDFVEEGFKEGDKIKLEANDGSGSNHNKTFLITGFTNSNKNITIETLDDAFSSNSTGELYTVSLESEEIKGPLIARGTDLANPSFLNKTVEVHKVFLDPETGEIKGNSSILLFKGLITKTSINEDPTKSSVVSWTLNSHWADFTRVQGRMTSDESHRALTTEGVPQRDATLKPDYADDMGFMHGDTSVNVLATYQEKYYEPKVTTSSHGLFGFKTKVQMSMEEKSRDRDVKLAVEMSAKFLPVVYGVRKVPGIPVFADTPDNDPDTIYVVYAICEGEIEALYDIYVDGQPLICLNESDFNDRNTTVSEPSSAVVCAGRADKGETLSGAASVTSSINSYPPGKQSKFYDEPRHVQDGMVFDEYDHAMGEWASVITNYQSLTNKTSISGGNVSDVGIRNGQQFKIEAPQDIKLWFHSGRFDQEANSQLINIATSTKFKRQADYFTSGEEYWSPNHRLLDTTYVVAEIKVTEAAADIPELEFVVKGKIHENYNYDFKYRHDDLSHSSENATDFIVGESVTFHRTSDNATLNTTTVKDVYKIANPETGDMMNAIRFGAKPFHTTNFAYVDDVPDHTQFYAKDASNNTWHMLTFNHTDLTAALPNQGSTISSIARNSSTGKVELSMADTALSGKTQFKIVGTGNGQFSNLENNTIKGTYSNQVITLDVYINTLSGSDTISSGRVIESRTIQLPSSASSANDFYNNQIIEVTSGTGVGQKRTITDYNGSTKVATLRSNFVDHPNSSSVYNISGRAKDLRSGNNPAMHTLDYLTAKTYGKGLSLTDLSLETFNNAARTCDSQSNITLSTTSSPTVGDEYFHTHNAQASGNIIARGKVKSVTATTTDYRVVLEDVHGQFQRLWNNWSYYEVGDIVFTEADGNIFRVTSAGYIGTKPTNASPQGTTYINNVSFFKTGATGTTLTSFFKKYVTKHSLYSADFVKYWRWLGWAHDNQRWVTRHQLNTIIETTNSLFQNTLSMLEHYNGMLSYSNGKYELEVEAQENAPLDNGSYHITQSDIIGPLKVTDDPSRKSFNTINATVSDPGNKWSNTSVSFYNSTFVKADRNVVKTGNIKFSGITNYWNGRINAEKFLRESRFPLQISFTTMPKGILMKAGQVLKIDYDRFGWNNRLFRIVDLDIQPNCLVGISAVEYNDDMYVISNARQTGVTNTELPGTAQTGAPGAPTALTASTDKFGTTILNWTRSSSFVEPTDCTEIWAADVNDRNHSSAVKVGEADDETTFSHSIGAEAAKYYWIRHKRNIRKRKSKSKGTKFSSYFPASATGGIAGVALQAAAITVTVTNPGMTLQQTAAGSINMTGSGTDIQVLLGESILIADQAGGQANNTFRVTAVASDFDSNSTADITIGSSSIVNDGSGNGTIVRFATHSNTTMDTPVITYTITVKNGVGSSIVTKRFQHFSVVQDGVVGANGLSVIPTNGAHNFVGDASGSASGTSFSCSFNVREGTTAFAYDGSSPYANNTFRYGTLVNSNVVNAVSSSGVITITNSSNILSGTGTSNQEGSITVPILDNSDGSLLSTQIISLTKTVGGGQRGGSIFTFEEATTSAISAGNAANFADSNFSNADAVAVGTAVIAASEDDDLVSNDRITVTDNSLGKAGTRVYTGDRVEAASSLQASDFSALVVETFNGSVIVDGTLSANKLTANTTLTNNLNVGSNMILGNSGKFYSTNKSSFADADAGLYMDGTGDFHVGDVNSFIKFDASAETLAIKANTIQFTSGSGISDFDGAYSTLTGKPTLFSGAYADLTSKPTFVNFTINGNTFSPTGTAVTLNTLGLGVTSAYMAGQNAMVFGNTNIQGGRILLTSSGTLTATTNTTTSDAGPDSSIDINAHTQQIIISDGS